MSNMSTKARVQKIMSLPEAQQIKEVNKIFDAVYRRQRRLNALAEEGRISYKTEYYLGRLAQFSNKSGAFINNARTLVKNDMHDTLFSKLYTAVKFMESPETTVKGAKRSFAESASRYGRTEKQQALHNKIWKYAYDKGILDIYDPSEFEDVLEEVEDKYESEGFDMQMNKVSELINDRLEKAGSSERINPNTGAPFRIPKSDNVSFKREAVAKSPFNFRELSKPEIAKMMIKPYSRNKKK